MILVGNIPPNPALNNTNVKTSSKNFTITNNGNKKVINLNNRKKELTPPPPANINPIQPLPNEQFSNDCMCLLLGIPQSFSVNEVLFAIKQINSDVSSKEGLVLIDHPLECSWEQSYDMDYLKLVFPNTKSAENLIVNSLKIMQNSVIVLPYFPQMQLIDLLAYHEIKILTSPKVDQLFIYQNFSIYGDIVNIFEENISNGGCFIVVFAHHNSAKTINQALQQNFQFELENGETVNFTIQRLEKPIPVKRPAANETMAARFNYSTMNMIHQTYLKNEGKTTNNPGIFILNKISKKLISFKINLSPCQQHHQERE